MGGAGNRVDLRDNVSERRERLMDLTKSYLSLQRVSSTSPSSQVHGFLLLPSKSLLLSEPLSKTRCLFHYRKRGIEQRRCLALIGVREPGFTQLSETRPTQDAYVPIEIVLCFMHLHESIPSVVTTDILGCNCESLGVE